MGKAQRVREAAGRGGRLLAALFAAVLGHWTPPRWLRALGGIASGVLRALAAWARREPRRAAMGLVLALVLAGSGWAGWRWYQQRPRPVEISFRVEAPGPTCYSCDAPDNEPKPLLIRFSASTAPLALAGKDVDAQRGGIAMSPALAGKWHWDDDRVLRFQPREDWPIGKSIEVRFAPRQFAAPQARLKEDVLRFPTTPFSASIVHTEFYQDPTTVSNKKVVVTVQFSHPVETRTFESRIRLRMYNRIADDQEQKLGDVPYTVQYDKLRLNAYIHSETLTIPPKQGRLSIEIDSGLRAARESNGSSEPLQASVTIPGRYSLTIDNAKPALVRDEQDEPRQVLQIASSFAVTEKELVPRVHAWLLPEANPDPRLQAEWNREHAGVPYPWSENELRKAVLDAAEPLALRYAPGEQDQAELNSFGYSAPPGRRLYVKIDKGLKSFGGYELGEPYSALIGVPPYPRELRIMHEGSLLALSGARKLSLFSRDVPAVRIRIGRLLPHQLQHLVTQSDGRYAQPSFRYGFDESNITEQRTLIRKLPAEQPGTPHYETIDFSDYLDKSGGDRRGMFVLHVEAWDAEHNRPLDRSAPTEAVNDSESDEGETPQDESGGDGQGSAAVDDTRLIVVTDLGMVVKKAVDGTQDVFVQSIHDGTAAAGVTVEVLGRNGEALLTQTTDDTGHARFADLASYKREQQPVLYLARRNGDSSFLPIDRYDRVLGLSRFDIGGVTESRDPKRLTAYLFSDRGIYRPGDEVNLGAIVRSQDWAPPPQGLPLQFEVVDPRGRLIKRERLMLGAAGLQALRFATHDSSPTGSYTVTLAIPKDEQRSDMLGSTTVKVQEFQPDRLKMNLALSKPAAQGWIAPEALQAEVGVMNLFGSPAENRRVTAEMTLTPGAPDFSAWKDYRFRDPQAASDGYSDTLAETHTDAQGRATLDLDLKRFARASYRLHLVAQAFEADGGRGVAGETVAFVSSLPYLIGWKADGDLGFIARNSTRNLSLQAIDPRLQKTAVKDLRLVRIQRKYVSVLTRQDSGVYKYLSKLKESVLDEKPLSLPADGLTLKLDSSAPGDYAYQITDADGQVYARVDYSISGTANLAAKLERNAELKLTLDRGDYAAGDDISIQVQAPYAGAGLITIERDKVYAWRWFKASTSASVQKIRVPEGLEGNAYVQVTYIRDPASEEIYTSPLSYGVQPFFIDREHRRTQITLEAPARIKPGERLNLHYSTSRPSRIMLYAVDEGILQVARYKTPDPLGYFFQKRALGVRTTQILDLILPEFARRDSLSAPGGDAEGALGRHLNPFKRRSDKPVAWWSGILDADSHPREAHYDVPDSFNGTLHVYAVAVADAAIGVQDAQTRVVGDFVLSPNVPLAVAPGDRFEVSLGVANQLSGSGSGARLAIDIEPSAQLEVEGETHRELGVAENREGSLQFRVHARDALGAASLRFRASVDGHSASILSTLSVRPATPFVQRITTGTLKSGTQEQALGPPLYPQYRQQEAGISVLPLLLAHGLVSYLGNYAYDCTEQLVSMALPAIVLGARPEFGAVKAQKGADLAALLDELRARQNDDGRYRYWPGNERVESFVSVYAQQVLIEAQERGLAVPKDLLDRGNEALRTMARSDNDTLDQERESAHAIYLLSRQGILAADEAAALQQRLEQRYAKQWRQDVTAAYLAAAYRLMKQESLAGKAIARVAFGGTHAGSRFHSGVSSDGELLYLLSRHFPERLAALSPETLPGLVDRVQKEGLSSLSAATTVLALDAYASAVAPAAAGQQGVEAIDSSGKARALPLAGLMARVTLDDTVAKLRFRNQADVPAYTLLLESGYERSPPTTPISEGLEILREYTDATGRPVQKARLGEELTVHVRFRAIGRSWINDLVLVDLLPGGFDPVIPAATPAQPDATADEATDAPPAGEDGEPPHVACVCRFLSTHPADFPDYADLREDRIVAYGFARDQVQEFSYRIKATTVGSFTVPPAYGESMYSPAVRARAAAGHIEVVAP